MAYNMVWPLGLILSKPSSVFFVFQNSDPDAMLFQSPSGPAAYNLYCSG